MRKLDWCPISPFMSYKIWHFLILNIGFYDSPKNETATWQSWEWDCYLTTLRMRLLLGNPGNMIATWQTREYHCYLTTLRFRLLPDSPGNETATWELWEWDCYLTTLGMKTATWKALRMKLLLESFENETANWQYWEWDQLDNTENEIFTWQPCLHNIYLIQLYTYLVTTIQPTTQSCKIWNYIWCCPIFINLISINGCENRWPTVIYIS